MRCRVAPVSRSSETPCVPMEWIQRAHCPIRPPTKPAKRMPKEWLSRLGVENDTACRHHQISEMQEAAENERKMLRERWRKQALRCYVDDSKNLMERKVLREQFGSCIDGTDKTANIILDAKIAVRGELYSHLPPRLPDSPMHSPAGPIDVFSAHGLRCEAQAQIEESNRLLRACAAYS